MKYVLEKWVNGEYAKNFLRPITRENKRYLISDVQRTVQNYKVPDKKYKYVFVYKWATKFTKDHSELGFRRSITKLSNTDGVMTYTVTDDPGTLKCAYSLEQVFGNDLRTIQQPYDYPLSQMYREAERYPVDKKHFFIELREHTGNFGKIEGWDNKVVLYLKELFKVSKVYCLILDEIKERKKQSLLTQTGTHFHLNTFGIDKKEISFDENYFNRTIMFWLFHDKLVFQYEEGKDTW